MLEQNEEVVPAYVEPEDKLIGSLYLELGDGGVKVSVRDHHGPTIVLESSTFGNLQHSFSFMTSVDGLVKIRDMINSALQGPFSKEYCHAVVPYIKSDKPA
jgi:hypothetical protein